MGETFFPSQEDRLKKLKSTDEAYGILLRRGYERGTLNDKQREEFSIGVQEGIFEPAEGMNEKISGFAQRARAGAERDETGLTGFDREYYDRELNEGTKGTALGRTRTASGELLNSASFGNADRITAAAAKTDISAARGSRLDLQRRMAKDMEAGGFEGDAALASARLSRKTDREANPISAMGGEIAGYIVPGAAGMKLTSGAVRLGARATGISGALMRAAPSGVTRSGRLARYATQVLPRAVAGGAVDGAVYGQTISRSNEEASRGEDIALFSKDANDLMLRDATYGAIFGGLTSPIYRAVRGGTTYASDLIRGVSKAERAGGRDGLSALEHRLTPKDRKKEVVFDNMSRMGMGTDEAQYVMKAIEEGRMEDADKVLRNSYNAALIMIEKRLRAEKIPIEALENKMRELAYAGDSVDEFFFEIAALAQSGKIQSLANALATVGGPGKKIAIEEFDDRSLSGFERVKETINDAFGFKGSDYYAQWDAMKERGQKQVNAAYEEAARTGHLSDEAWGALAHESDGMSIIRQRSMKEAIDNAAGLAEDASDYKSARELKKVKKAADQIEAARQELDDAIEAGTDQGAIDAAGDRLVKAQSALFDAKPTVSAFKYIDQELTDMRFKANGPMSTRNPRGVADSQNTLRKLTDQETGLDKARDVNAKFETADDAFEEGRKMFAQGTDVETLLNKFAKQIDRYDGSNPEILPALLQGFVRGAEDAMSTAGGLGTALRRIYGSPRSRQKLEEMLKKARELSAARAANPAQAKAVKTAMTKALRALLGGERQVKKVSPDGASYKSRVEVPGRIKREISMEDSKQQTIRGSQTASRLQSIREQDEFADAVDEVLDAASKGPMAFVGKYGRAAARRVTQSGIYTNDINRELANIMFRGGKEHIEQTIANLKRVRSARMGKGDLDVLSAPQRSKISSGGAAGGTQNMTAGAKRRAALAGQRGSVNVDAAMMIAGGAVGWNRAQDLDNDGTVSFWERATFAVGGAIFGKALIAQPGRAGTFYMYMGQNAKTADLDALARAQKMFRDEPFPNMSREQAIEEVRRKTGWFLDDDKKWKFEVDDSKALTADEIDVQLQDVRQRIELSAPLFAVGRQMDEELVVAGEITRAEADDRAEKAFEAMGFGKMKQKEKELLDARLTVKRTDNTGRTQSTYGMPLSEAISHPALFEAYPQLKDAEVVMRPMPPNNLGQAAYDPVTKKVVLTINSAMPARKKRQVILHEVMHVIQEEEGFARGGSPSDPRYKQVGNAVVAYKVGQLREEFQKIQRLDPYADERDAIDRAAEYLSSNADSDFPTYLRRYVLDQNNFPDRYISNMQKMYRVREERPGVFRHDSPYEIYTRLRGEIEARDVETRMDYTPEQRDYRSPRETQAEDVPRSDMIDEGDYRSGDYYNADPAAREGSSQLSEAREVPGRSDMDGGSESVRWPLAEVLSPLEGSPKRVTVPGVGKVDVVPHGPARQARDAYIAKTGRKYTPIKTYKKVDQQRATNIAKAFDDMPHQPSDPKVLASYNKMIDETVEQWKTIQETSGLKVEFIKEGMGDPYAASPRLAIEDVKNNNHLWVYPTDSGYGQGAITAEEIAQNPLLRDTGIMIDGQSARANDIFRIVHDYFGHIAEGNGFRADGEENAWRLHASMYSPEAVPAMTTETRGQNSWLNFGPHGEANRNAKSIDTVYAEQKIGLLPDWAHTDGLADDLPDNPAIAQAVKFETPGSPEWEAAKAKGLDMSQAGRMARAKEAGFDTETVLYHGTTADITSFEPSRKGVAGPGVYLTSSADEASSYASARSMVSGAEGGAVLPVYVRGKIMRVQGDPLPETVASAKSQGYSGIEFNSGFGPPNLVIFDPSNIRSVNAAFDPDKAASPMIMSGFGLPGGFKAIDKGITEWGKGVAEKVRTRLAPIDDPRHYGPMLKKYGMPDVDEVVYNKPLYEQVADPRAAARDIADSASMSGGRESGERAIEYVASTRSKRVQGREIAKDRASAIKEQGAAGQALADALREVEQFFGPNGAHRKFKTAKAKRAAYVGLIEDVRIAEEAANAAMGGQTPRMPELPPEREQMLVQELNRAERPAGYRSVDAMRDMSVYDTNGMREAPDIASQYDQAMPVKPNAKPRPPGRRRAAIDNRATEMMLDPSMVGEGVKAARDGGDGFAVSNRVGRAVGYGAVGAAGLAYAGHAAMVKSEVESWDKAEKDLSEKQAALDSAEPVRRRNLWDTMDTNNRTRMQNNLNAVNQNQISVDGSWGAQTEAAIREFQEAAGLEVTGVFDDPTVKALNLLAEKRSWQWSQEEKRKQRVGRSASIELQ